MLTTEKKTLNKSKSGAWLARYALEQLPISFTFGIPGVHNTELYDEFNISESIQPILVTHEEGASFMADAISRTTSSEQIGCMLVVPAAGLTHAMSGIGEAYLDGVPMLVLSGGIRTDTPMENQLHELSHKKLLDGITKESFLVTEHQEIVPTIFKAYELATSGFPGPVHVEIPVNVQLFQDKVESLPVFNLPQIPVFQQTDLIDKAVEQLCNAQHPAIYVGWGAVDVDSDVIGIAEALGATVATTLQGLSAFPASHPLHAGMGFSEAAVPAATNAFKNCDCLLSIGVAFSEIPTGSFSCVVPDKHIHIDIKEENIGRNFPVSVGLAGDSRDIVPRLQKKLASSTIEQESRAKQVADKIKLDKEMYLEEWQSHINENVNPALFFKALSNMLNPEDITVLDDGNHTFLAAELHSIKTPRSLICPSDFNAMGYCVPAAIGAKFANPDKRVVGIVGDGCFIMTCMEILTASAHNLGVIYFIFSDGELSQIAQGQEIPYNRKTCTVMGNIKVEGVALATGAKYIPLTNNADIQSKIKEAFTASDAGQPVIVDIKIDYSKRTRYTKGVVKAVLKRFPLGEKFRFISRAVLRKFKG